MRCCRCVVDSEFGPLRRSLRRVAVVVAAETGGNDGMGIEIAAAVSPIVGSLAPSIARVFPVGAAAAAVTVVRVTDCSPAAAAVESPLCHFHYLGPILRFFLHLFSVPCCDADDDDRHR